jgi:hypothetical protein
MIVCLVWCSAMRYQLKAATLLVAVIIATPYAFATDLGRDRDSGAVLASDQIHRGLLKVSKRR